jgi:hypothetical protein
MVSFVKSLGVPVGTEKRPEGDDPAHTIVAKMSARTLKKVAQGEEFRVMSVAEAEDTLKAWLTAEYVNANRDQLLQTGDSILFATMVNDTDNYEVKNGHAMVNLGNQGILNQETFRFWAFNGEQEKIKIDNKGDKVGEKARVQGLVFIPSTDRRILWRAEVTKVMDGLDDPNHREYNLGDTAAAILEPLVQEGGDHVQYGTLNYWDKSENKETMGIEVKIYHNNTIGLADSNWADNKAETHFPLVEEIEGVDDKTHYIVATHYGEDNPDSEDYREEGNVYRKRSCKNPDLSMDQCTLKDGYNYSDIYISYKKPRGNAEGTVTFYDEDGNVLDEQVVEN